MRAGHVGLSVLVNKYDGIDLPGDACRLLIIDGLPEVLGLLERAEQNFLDGTDAQLARQIQRIEQAWDAAYARAKISVSSSCSGRVSRNACTGRRPGECSPRYEAQLDLGRSVTEQIVGQPISEILKVMQLCLERDDEWVAASRNAVLSVEPDGESHVNPVRSCISGQPSTRPVSVSLALPRRKRSRRSMASRKHV